MPRKATRSAAPVGFDESLCTIREACDALRIRTTKCYELLNSGALEGVLLGSRSRRIKRSSVDRLIQRGVQQEGAAK